MPNYPPITYKDPATNQLMGFDIELGEAIAKELGLKPEWQEIAFAQMLPSLADRPRRHGHGRHERPAGAARDGGFRRLHEVRGRSSTPSRRSRARSRRPTTCAARRSARAARRTGRRRSKEWSDQNCVAKGKPAMNVVGTEGSVDARTQLKTQRLQGRGAGQRDPALFPDSRSRTPSWSWAKPSPKPVRHPVREDRRGRAAARRRQGRDRAPAAEGRVRPDPREIRAQRQRAEARRRQPGRRAGLKPS